MGLIGSGTTNECKVLTIFPLGVECNTTNPSTTTSLDGIVSLDITGGTAPYSIVWSNGATAQTLYGLGGGEYTATVTDYYGDFTSTTVCVLVQPTTTTTTYTPTTTINYRRGYTFCLNLCGSECDTFTFEAGNIINGYNSWTSSTMTIFFNPTSLRWELSGYTVPLGYTAGLIYSNNPGNSNPPLDWYTLGNNYRPNASAVEGECELQDISIVKTITHSSCASANDGSIVLQPTGGVGPFQYSKNGGLTYQPSAIFTNLAAGVYTMVIKDTSNNQVVSNVVTITNQNTVRTFDLTINPTTPITTYIPPNVFAIPQISSQTKEITPFTVSVSPALMVGETLGFVFVFRTNTQFQSPGDADFTNNLLLYKNGIPVVGTTTTNTTSTAVCTSETLESVNALTTFPVSLTYGDVVTGSLYSNTSLSATSSVLGCTSVANNTVTFYPQNVTITPQKCRTIGNVSRATIISNNLAYINPPLNLTFSNRWVRSDEDAVNGFVYDGNVNNPSSPGTSPKISYNFTNGCLVENVSCFPLASTVPGGPIYVVGQNQITVAQGTRGSDINLWLRLGGLVSGGSCAKIFGTLKVSVNGGAYTTLTTLNGGLGSCSKTHTYGIPLNANSLEFVWEQTRI